MTRAASNASNGWAPDSWRGLPIRQVPGYSDEAGLAGFHTSVWHAMWVPAATPGAIIERLNREAERRLRNAEPLRAAPEVQFLRKNDEILEVP